MTHFLFSSLCLLAFWLFYKLALENISWHNFKRFYLLGVLVFSVVIPFIVVKVNYVEIQQQMFTPFEVVASPVTDQSVANNEVGVAKSSFDWIQLSAILYVIGLIIMAVRFGRNLWSLKINPSDQVSRLGRYLLVEKKDLSVPCSFMSRIYVPKNKEVPTHILNHEKAHLEQRHSWDIIFIEILLIVFWFHPLLYLMKYSIKLNHEFLADQAVLKNGFPLSNYQKSLLEFMQRDGNKQLAHTYNFPLIKKRFTIMNKQTKTTQALLRVLATIPLVALLIISCGKEKDEAVLIDHAINVSSHLPEGTDHVYGYSFDPYTPKGITEYNGVSYNYEMQDDFTVKLFTMDGREIDQELNSLHGSATWDAEREINDLLSNSNKTRQQIADGTLKIITSDLYTNEDDRLALTETVELTIEQLKKLDAASLSVMKFMSGDTLNFYVSKSIHLETRKPITYIDNNSPRGNIIIDETSYSYTNGKEGIKIFDKNNKEINWYEKGWDIRERLVRPNDDDFDNLTELYTGLKKGSKIFVNNKEITEIEFRKIAHHKADSVRVENKNGFNYYYIYNPIPPTANYKLLDDTNSADYEVVQVTKETFEHQQKNPVAAAMIKAMQLKYGDDAVFYLDGTEVLASTVLLAASHDSTLGFKLENDPQNRPSLDAAVGLPYTIDDLQDTYAQLFKGIDRNKKTLVYYETPVDAVKKQPGSGYGISLDSINFKNK